MKVRPILTGVLLLLAAGCATSAPSAESRPRVDRNVISVEEVRNAAVGNAYELVQSLRPAWLRVRGRQSFNDPGIVIVYYDNVRLGGPEALRSVPVSGVASMQYIDAPSATQRWGTNHNHGAILIHGPSGR